MKVEMRRQELGLELPPPANPVANYVPYVLTGNLLFLAGHGGPREERTAGKLGRDLTSEQGYEAARLVALNLLATPNSALDDLRAIQLSQIGEETRSW